MNVKHIVGRQNLLYSKKTAMAHSLDREIFA